MDKLRCLTGKLRSLHLAVPGAIGPLYHLQTALTRADTNRQTYISKGIHRNIAHWIFLCTGFFSGTTFIAEIVQRTWKALGFLTRQARELGVCGLTRTVIDAFLFSTLNDLRTFLQTLLAGITLMSASQKVTLNWQHLFCTNIVSHLCVWPPSGTPQPPSRITHQL